MGYYIETPGTIGKANYIAQNYGGIVVTQSVAQSAIADAAKGVIVIVSNGMFEAAAFAYNQSEFDAFTQSDDHRPRTFLVMDRQLAKELSNCPSRIS